MKNKIEYGILNVNNRNLIVEKAKTKKDGVYSLRGLHYRVRGNVVTHFTNSEREVLLNCGPTYTVVVDTFKEQWDAKSALLNIIGY